MTGFLLLFTGFLATISNQGDNPYCVAYATATCASVYGMKEDGYKIARNELYITVEGYGYTLPRLTRFNISNEYYTTTGTISDKLKHGPLIAGLAQGVVIDGFTLPYGHMACLVGETENDWIIANSRGERFGVKGYQRVSKSQTNMIKFQDFGSGNLIAQLTGIKVPEQVKPIVKLSKFKALLKKK